MTKSNEQPKADLRPRAYRVTITGLAIYAPMSDSEWDTLGHLDLADIVELMQSEHNHAEIEIVELTEPKKVVK